MCSQIIYFIFIIFFFFTFNPLIKSKFRFYKWIKGKKEKENKDKIEYLATHFECSKKEAKDYLSLLDKKTINNIIKNYKQ